METQLKVVQKGQLNEQARKSLEKQHYKIIGMHSAVKTCGWTKKMIKDEGGCYKLKFYGIMSSQCMQMTTSISCANRCSFCWRDYKAPVSKNWEWGVDEPEFILEESMKAHHQLLVGLKGYKGTNMNAFKKSQQIKHVALSLTGEPITYPRMNELVDGFHRRCVSTFVVTNAQYPDHIKDLKPITQLYISLDAPTKNLLKTVDVPLFQDYWERLNKSLEYMSDKKQRTCIRLTLVKGVNMAEPEKYAEMIRKGNPDFIEIKAYMFVGASRERLKQENMPYHEDVVAFTKQLMECLPEYDIVSEHIPSRVVMCAKREFNKEGKWNTWIDFNKFHKLALSGQDFSTEDYLLPTPQTGIGETRNQLIQIGAKPVKVDEKTEELVFWKDKKIKS